jgi:thiamine biosynthesis protein ThiS
MNLVPSEITLEINGERRTLPGAATVAELLARLGIGPGRIAVELNRRIVRRADWEHTPVADRDRIEIVQFVGGG